MKSIFWAFIFVMGFGFFNPLTQAARSTKTVLTDADFGETLAICLGDAAGPTREQCEDHFGVKRADGGKPAPEVIVTEKSKDRVLEDIGVDCISRGTQISTKKSAGGIVIPSTKWLSFLASGVESIPNNGRHLSNSKEDQRLRKLNMIALFQAYGTCSETSDYALDAKKEVEMKVGNFFSTNKGEVTSLKSNEANIVRDYASGKYQDVTCVNAGMKKEKCNEVFSEEIHKIYAVNDRGFKKLFGIADVTDYTPQEMHDKFFAPFLAEGTAERTDVLSYINSSANSAPGLKSCLANIQLKESGDARARIPADPRFQAGSQENRSLCRDVMYNCGFQGKDLNLCDTTVNGTKPAPQALPPANKPAS